MGSPIPHLAVSRSVLFKNGKKTLSILIILCVESVFSSSEPEKNCAPMASSTRYVSPDCGPLASRPKVPLTLSCNGVPRSSLGSSGF